MPKSIPPEKKPEDREQAPRGTSIKTSPIAANPNVFNMLMGFSNSIFVIPALVLNSFHSNLIPFYSFKDWKLPFEMSELIILVLKDGTNSQLTVAVTDYGI